MGLLHTNLVMFFLLLCFEPLHTTAADSSLPSGAKALDATLQHYAHNALVKPKTGTIYNAQLPSNLNGIKVSALRLRSGSLRRKGYPNYNEFEIPKGIIERPYVERLVLVYQNLGNLDLSRKYYPLENYTYLAPILGLLAYNGSDLSTRNLPELDDVKAYGDPVLIKFRNVKPVPSGAVAKCVWFDLKGTSNFTNVTGEGNTCSTSQQGHFAIVVESPSAPSPAPAPAGGGGGGGKKSHKKVWIIVGSVLGGLALLVVLLLLVLWIQKYKEKKKMQQMERAAEVGEALNMTSIGDTMAPSATVTRTQPSLEHEYAP
ncbi:hypothetical protein HN51_005543 [Arachis hypogaea]|uniref:Uncharacterized protein LOC107485402 n=2 Tax=Arachis TaxID=3817 RepID=A0A6P4D5Z6_ARADU|nr:uncharacterized protein LOC107485402 [Arachis duranensis]XP_025695894.1 uncharacterized protein LOC112797261 [Arachis hypogaea]QHO39319.1 uncharacterized protein DS421_4g128070 [Arachis hypogaea]